MTAEERRAIVLQSINDLFAELGRPLKIREIARRSDLPLGTTHRHVIRLWVQGKCERLQYLERGGSIKPVEHN